ncbi:hypothetical protein [Methylosinus trichosporium]
MLKGPAAMEFGRGEPGGTILTGTPRTFLGSTRVAF